MVIMLSEFTVKECNELFLIMRVEHFGNIQFKTFCAPLYNQASGADRVLLQNWEEYLWTRVRLWCKPYTVVRCCIT